MIYVSHHGTTQLGRGLPSGPNCSQPFGNLTMGLVTENYMFPSPTDLEETPIVHFPRTSLAAPPDRAFLERL